MKKVVLGLSGGMDSATLCGWYLSQGFEVFPLAFSYGSKHNLYENRCAQALAKHWKLDLKSIDLKFIGELFNSNLLKKGGDIPEGYYTDTSMSKTVVPGRNIIFASIMSGYAWSIGADRIALGVHAGDHAIYEDCRQGFIAAMNAAVISGTGDRIHIETPFLYLNKAEILQIGMRDSIVPYELTRTCYKDQELSCGKCGSCQERLEAFNIINMKDPIRYE